MRDAGARKCFESILWCLSHFIRLEILSRWVGRLLYHNIHTLAEADVCKCFARARLAMLSSETLNRLKSFNYKHITLCLSVCRIFQFHMILHSPYSNNVLYIRLRLYTNEILQTGIFRVESEFASVRARAKILREIFVQVVVCVIN